MENNLIDFAGYDDLSFFEANCKLDPELCPIKVIEFLKSDEFVIRCLIEQEELSKMFQKAKNIVYEEQKSNFDVQCSSTNSFCNSAFGQS